jgi:hypothetical protein
MRILLAAIVVLAGVTTAFADPFTSTPSYGGPGMKAWYGNQGQTAAPDAVVSHPTHVNGHKHHHKHRTPTPR